MQFLFHGADKATLELICREGFDTRVSNLSGLLGAGNYFAFAASYSHDYSRNVRETFPLIRRPLGPVLGPMQSPRHGQAFCIRPRLHSFLTCAMCTAPCAGTINCA